MSLVAVSGNVSFITSIGNIGLGIPASESPFLYSILKSKGIEKITSLNLLELFKGSITKIKDYLINENTNNPNYCAAGLQELNNTQTVHDTVKQIIGDDFTFICKNTIDAYMSTYPTSGFIISGFDPAKFKQIQTDLYDKINVYSRKSISVDSREARVLDEKDKNSSYSQIVETITETTQVETTQPTLTAYELSKYMSIRDLGTPYEFTTKDEKKSVFLKNDASPDAGRCIGMVVKMNDATTIDVIHLNCHMVNPSAIKVFEINGDTLKPDGKYNVTNLENNKTIMQLGDTYTEEWLKYCVKRLEECIGEMLVDFELTIDNIVKNTKFVLTGDLNDSDGKLIDKLSTDGIQIGEKTIKFTRPIKKLLTACPNVNSANVTILGMDEDPKKRDGFNKSLKSLTEGSDKNTLETYYLMKDDVTQLVTNPANYAFEGDVVLFGKVEGGLLSDNGFVDGEGKPNAEKPNNYNLDITTKEDILKQTSDHLFVWGKTLEVSLVGGRRKTRKHRKTKKKRHLKKNSKKKNTLKR